MGEQACWCWLSCCLWSRAVLLGLRVSIRLSEASHAHGPAGAGTCADCYPLKQPVVGFHRRRGVSSHFPEPQYNRLSNGAKCAVRLEKAGQALALGRLLRPHRCRVVRGRGGTQEYGWSHQAGLLHISSQLRSGWGVVPPLAGQGTELEGGWGHQEGIGPVVAGAGLPGGHREAEALQEAGEEEEELHAGQGLPEA